MSVREPSNQERTSLEHYALVHVVTVDQAPAHDPPVVSFDKVDLVSVRVAFDVFAFQLLDWEGAESVDHCAM